jgi:hypothetical protein
VREQRGSEERRDDRRASDAARENERRGSGARVWATGEGGSRTYICPAPNGRIQRSGAAIQRSGGAGLGAGRW